MKDLWKYSQNFLRLYDPKTTKSHLEITNNMDWTLRYEFHNFLLERFSMLWIYF
jgi:hypothetical protein